MKALIIIKNVSNIITTKVISHIRLNLILENREKYKVLKDPKFFKSQEIVSGWIKKVRPSLL